MLLYQPWVSRHIRNDYFVTLWGLKYMNNSTLGLFGSSGQAGHPSFGGRWALDLLRASRFEKPSEQEGEKRSKCLGESPGFLESSAGPKLHSRTLCNVLLGVGTVYIWSVLHIYPHTHLYIHIQWRETERERERARGGGLCAQGGGLPFSPHTP